MGTQLANVAPAALFLPEGVIFPLGDHVFNVISHAHWFDLSTYEFPGAHVAPRNNKFRTLIVWAIWE